MPNFNKKGPCGKGHCMGGGFGPCGSKDGQEDHGHCQGKDHDCGEPKTKEEKAKILAERRKFLEEKLEYVKNEQAKLA